MSLIRVESDARGVATLTLARAEKHNALSAGMMTELERAARDLAADRSVRVVVLAAEGKTFAPVLTPAEFEAIKSMCEQDPDVEEFEFF